MNAIRVRLSCRKLATMFVSHSRKPFLLRTARRRSWETLLYTPVRSRLKIDTTLLGLAFYAASTYAVIRLIAERVDLFFLTPI